MGQYYFGVIRQKESREVIAAEYCCKLIESGWGDMSYLAYALSKNGIGYMQRVCWAGDYSDLKDADGKNLYDHIDEREDEWQEWVPELKGLSREDRHQWWLEHVCQNEDGLMRDELRYVCCHDRKEFIDLQKLKFTGVGFDNSIAVLTSDPTCRISGGGDYCFQDNYEMYAAWYDCVLSTEPVVPEGYQEVNGYFGTEQKIWDYNGVRLALYGEKGYDAPYPNYSEFSSFLSHGRYQEFQNGLCVMPLNDLKAMYAKWYQDLNLEHVFKAFDTIARVLKHDPHLEQEHKGVTFRVTDYDLHYLDCDGVSVCIYKERKNSPWRMLRNRADYNGLRYDCDRKSRAYHRRRLEAINMGWYDAA